MNARHDLLEVEALVFDAYGTLFDVHSVMELAEVLAPARGAALSQLWRAKQLEYTWLGSLMTTKSVPRADFATVTDQALGYALAALGIGLSGDDQRRLRDAYLTLAPFPDTRGTLSALAPRPRWILSNGTLGMLLPVLAHAKLDGLVDGVLSVDAAGIYKPSPRVYQLAVDQLRLPAARIGFVSSNAWDAIGAKAFGFTTIWINRAGAPIDRHGPPPDRVIAALSELPPLFLHD